MYCILKMNNTHSNGYKYIFPFTINKFEYKMEKINFGDLNTSVGIFLVFLNIDPLNELNKYFLFITYHNLYIYIY